MNLVIDQGNTFFKFGIFDKHELVVSKKFKTFNLDWISRISSDYRIDRCIFSSVTKEGFNLFQEIKNTKPESIFLNTETKLPFKNLYKTPQSLGKDRIAAVAGAFETHPKSNVLVIDAGTAITFDVITISNEYIGGNISPGLQLRFNALHEKTSQLPLLNKSDNYKFIGSTTEEAIISGVQNSIIFEIEGYINDLLKKYADLKTIITGGDAEFFAGKLKNPIFVDLNIVLKGLNRILIYNA